MPLSEFDSDTTTKGIRVQVRTRYVPEQSDARSGLSFFAYQIRIVNEGEAPAQLVSRHWVITDGWGRVQEVKGPGVVGHQPRLEPGQAFEYTSACPLPTPTGSMEGWYQMLRDDGEQFDARIDPFYLVVPGQVN